MTFRPVRAFVCALLVLVMSASGALAGTIAEARSLGASDWLVLAAALVGNGPGRALAGALVGPSSVGYGSDGRLTILLLGSDKRPPGGPNLGERIDSMIVMTINPNNKRAAAVSMPRDIANVPMPGGQIYKKRVNTLNQYYSHQGFSRNAALGKIRDELAYVLDIEIDYVAYVRFFSFTALIDEIDGVPVNITAAVYDTRMGKFLVDPNALMHGINAPACSGPVDGSWSAAPTCYRSLRYVRSRHGTDGGKANNDWRRARRQQSFVAATVDRVVARGNGANLWSLRDKWNSLGAHVYTDVPTDNGSLLALFSLLDGATLSPADQYVLKPSKYAERAPGEAARQQLKLSAVRALCAQVFAAVP